MVPRMVSGGSEKPIGAMTTESIGSKATESAFSKETYFFWA